MPKNNKTTIAKKKKDLLSKLKNVHSDLKSLQKDFKDIRKKGRSVIVKASKSEDAKKIADIKKKLHSK